MEAGEESELDSGGGKTSDPEEETSRCVVVLGFRLKGSVDKHA